jgi:uncharacterized protein DUF87
MDYAMTSELEAFRSVDFVWTRQLKSIWRDQPYHVPTIHKGVVDDLFAYFVSTTHNPDPDNEPLGRIVVGPAGLGKTHLVGELRQRVWESGGTFILLDFVGVKDFWSSVALGFLNSLQIRVSDERTQYDQLILRIASSLSLQSQLTEIAARLRGRPRELIAELVRVFLDALMRQDRQSTLKHRDVIRALVLLISDDLECASIAHGWLQGMDLDSEQVRDLGFVSVKKPAIEIVRGMAWLLSLAGPTLIAVDQIDAIISEANMRSHKGSTQDQDEQSREAQSIIEALAGGLMDLHEVKRRAVIIVSSLEASWSVLKQKATVAATDRYHAPTVLRAIDHADAARSLVSARLNQAYSACGFVPAYETWPFSPKGFESAVGFSPRQLLKACEEHRQRCLANGIMFECTSFVETPSVSPVPPARRDGVDEIFNDERKKAEIEDLLAQKSEDQLRALFTDILDIYSRHLEPPDDIDVVVQPDPDQRRPSLHGRLTFIFRNEGDREQHYCFRVLAHANAIAFQSRLRAAMTASGVDRALKFRHLFILRRDAPPSGAKTKELVAKFHQADGKFIAPTEEDVRTFVALRAMLLRNLDGIDAWLRTRKPLFDTPLFKTAELCPPPFLCSRRGPNGGAGPIEPSPAPQPRPRSTPAQQQDDASTRGPQHEKAAPSPATGDLPLGHRYERGAPEAPVKLPADLLPRHVAILAGSGSGKTVLLRRIVEEAALLGIPAIVLDTNNDLGRLGDPWPERPEGFSDADAVRAAEYQRAVDVVIWTPGRSGGRPVSLGLLPDFAALGDDPDERDQAIEMARATLAPFIGATGASAKLKEGVLADALRRFAREGGGVLRQLIDLLSNLPDGISQIGNAPKLASAIADQLLATIATNPLLQPRGENLDPEVLFNGRADKTRISVINFSGLASDEARQSFVNQLQMALFTWIKRNPSQSGRLYVLDEAQNFAPSQKMTPCKESTVSLAAQARKYGLGMIFATQTPKGIDNKIVSNCTTHFYGRMSAPATIDATRELMAAKGGAADDIGRLSRGEFYFSTEGIGRPVKIRTPLCLTWHPPNPLTAEEVVTKARA